MGEREQMRLRELKETAHALFVRGRFAQCAEIYSRILRLAPKDPNARVRHAEACRRAGDRQGAIYSYRTAAELLLEQGCESRARGALRAALELDPKDPMILSDLARLGCTSSPTTAQEDERLSTGMTGFFERPDATEGTRGFVPPPPPPAYVLRAAEETPVPGPLPAAPPIAPVSLEALQRAAGRGSPMVAPIPLVNAVGVAPRRGVPGSPTMAPAPGRSLSRAAVPSPSARPAGASVPPPLPTIRRPVPPVIIAHAQGAAPMPAPTSRHAGAAPHPAGATVAPMPGTRSAGASLEQQLAGATMAPVPGAAGQHSAGATLHPAHPGAPSSQEVSMTMAPLMPYKPELRRLGPNAVALRVSPQARWVIIRSDSPLEVSRAVTLPAPPQQPVAVPTSDATDASQATTPR